MEGAHNYAWEAMLFDFHTYPGTPILLIAFLSSFALSFAVGANDSANSWGTSVGAGTVSMGWAYVLGSLSETFGAVFLSGNVVKKLVSGIINVDAYRSDPNQTLADWEAGNNGGEDGLIYLRGETQLLIGMLSVMLGSSLWQLVASLLAWPVSGSHSIVSGLLGFTLVARGTAGVGNIAELYKIAIGWVASPLISMALTSALYLPLYRFCIRSATPFSTPNRLVYSVLVWLAVGFNFLNLFVTGDLFLEPAGWGMDWSNGKAYFTAIAFALGFGVGLAYLLFVIPRLVRMATGSDFALTCGLARRLCRRQPEKISERSDSDSGVEVYIQQLEVISKVAMVDVEDGKRRPEIQKEEDVDNGDDGPEVMRIFRPLQVLSACTGALAHGGNDVGNCIGPLVLIYHVYQVRTEQIDQKNVHY
jgi:sodium-dependent phosphate transporter